MPRSIQKAAYRRAANHRPANFADSLRVEG